MRWYYDFKPYVSVGQRRAQAKRSMDALRKKGVDIQPVEIEGRKIAKTFWGKAWCDHLESFSDYENRLPRGRSYVRNGSVCHLAITQGKIEAKVSGTEIYDLCIEIKTLPAKKWAAVKQRSAGQIGSLLELLQGELSDQVMEVVTDRNEGLFPLPGEISFDCDCPDWAVMCKHVAAVLYGVGARLDEKPQLLFTLRGVDYEELIEANAETAVSAVTTRGTSKRLATGDLADVFGIDLDADNSPGSRQAMPKKRTPKKKKAAKKKKSVKQVAKKKSARKATKKVSAKKKNTTKKSTAKKVAAKKVAKKKVPKRKTVTKKTTPKKKTETKATAKNTAVKKKVGRKAVKKKTSARR